MDKQLTYSEQQNVKNTLKLREILKDLPAFCTTYFRGIEQTTASRTRIGYATDLKVFFNYIHENIPEYSDIAVKDYKLDILDSLKSTDIEGFLESLKYYEKDGKVMIPISVQVHHSFVDGLHIGQFVDELQKFLEEC